MSQMILKNRGRTCSICGELVPKVSAKKLIEMGYWKLGCKKPYRVYFSYFTICPNHSKEEVGAWLASEFTWIQGGEDTVQEPKPPIKRVKAVRFQDEQLDWIVDELERRLKR